MSSNLEIQKVAPSFSCTAALAAEQIPTIVVFLIPTTTVSYLFDQRGSGRNQRPLQN
jgi:hypothetical protein